MQTPKTQPTQLIDGVLYWADRDPSTFATPGHYEMWRKRFLGKPVEKQRARKILKEVLGIEGLAYSIDHDYLNACVANLTAKRTRPKNSNNISGCTGVHFCHQTQKWKVEIYIGGKRRYLGRYSSYIDAVVVRKSYEKQLGYPEGYGE